VITYRTGQAFYIPDYSTTYLLAANCRVYKNKTLTISAAIYQTGGVTSTNNTFCISAWYR